MSQYKNCILCGENKTKVFKKLNGFTIVQCINDDFIYVNPQPGEVEIKNFYTKEYFNSEKRFGYQNYLELEKSLKIDAKRLLKSIRPYGGDLLDIGCSFGFLLEVARELGFKVFGADISQDCINYCISKGFIVKSLSDYNDNFFDIITLIGVIDHFSDPIKDFQEIKRVSKPGASIIIRIANMDLFLGRHSTVKPPEHLYYFSSATLKRFLEDNGFQVTNIRRSLTPFTIDEFSFRVFRYLFRISHYDFWFDIQKLISGILKFLKMDKIVILFPDGQIILNARCKK